MNTDDKYPYYHAQILITKNKDKFVSIFHPKTMFETLSDTHLLKLFFLQKIKIAANNPTKLCIYLYDLDLEDFNLNPKLLYIAKHCSEPMNVFFLDSNNVDLNQAIQYKQFMEKYSS